MKKFLLAALLPTILLCSCSEKMKEFQKHANEQFGDQHFKTTISLIELYKVRHGDYPSSLDSLEFTGDWDMMAINSTKYKKLEEGYELNLTKGWIGNVDSLHLKYPPAFWKGLGIKKSNIPITKDEDIATEETEETK